MKKIDLKMDMSGIMKKLPLGRTLEAFMLLLFVAAAIAATWIWYDIGQKTMNENVPESKLVSDDTALKLNRIKASFDDKTDGNPVDTAGMRNPF